MLTLVTILCGALLILVTAAVIFSERFRHDLLAGKDEAKVLGILNVKGATLTVVLGLFLGAVLFSASKSSMTLERLSKVVPEEGPQLSEWIGQDIGNLQKSHLALVRAYFGAKRVEVEGFLRDKWIPTYAKHLADNESLRSQMARALTTRSGELASILSELHSTQQQQIVAQRDELMRPLDEQEVQLIRQIEESYQRLLDGNKVITELLRSLR